MNSKYSAFLTVLLVIIIIAIVGIIGFLGYKFIASENSKKEAEDFADSWSENISQNTKKEETTDTKIDDNPNNRTPKSSSSWALESNWNINWNKYKFWRRNEI